MNCKPGDMAFIRNTGTKYDGWVVEVMYAAPSGNFILPNGQSHYGVGEARWVIHSLGSTLCAQMRGGGSRETMYGVCHDQYLFPILPDTSQPIEDKQEVEA